ncbi:hypothetical protein Droror1_Dr00017638 [Drosera rotundifolia]
MGCVGRLLCLQNCKFFSFMFFNCDQSCSFLSFCPGDCEPGFGKLEFEAEADDLEELFDLDDWGVEVYRAHNVKPETDMLSPCLLCRNGIETTKTEKGKVIHAGE